MAFRLRLSLRSHSCLPSFGQHGQKPAGSSQRIPVTISPQKPYVNAASLASVSGVGSKVFAGPSLLVGGPTNLVAPLAASMGSVSSKLRGAVSSSQCSETSSTRHGPHRLVLVRPSPVCYQSAPDFERDATSPPNVEVLVNDCASSNASGYGSDVESGNEEEPPHKAYSQSATSLDVETKKKEEKKTAMPQAAGSPNMDADSHAGQQLYEQGTSWFLGRQGREVNVTRALECWKAALEEHNNKDARYSLGAWYLSEYRRQREKEVANANGSGRMNGEKQAGLADALELLSHDSLRQHAQTQVLLGELSERGEGLPQSDVIALRHYSRAAQLGSPRAHLICATWMLTSRGCEVPVVDEDIIRSHYAAAAEGGESLGMLNYANMLLSGRGGPTDLTAGFQWMCRAADLGNARAQYNVGTQYFLGKGVGQNFEQAEKYWTLSASQGFTLAQVNLGTLLLEGRSSAVGRNRLAEAIKWLREAAGRSDLARSKLAAAEQMQARLQSQPSTTPLHTEQPEDDLSRFRASFQQHQSQSQSQSQSPLDSEEAAPTTTLPHQRVTKPLY
jgi:uncharacterized protein